MNEKLKAALERYFAPGAIIPGSNQQSDRVIEFRWNNGDWSVTVETLRKDGSIDTTYGPRGLRTHATFPNALYEEVYGKNA